MIKSEINGSKGYIDIYARDYASGTIGTILSKIPTTRTITVQAVAARNNALTGMANGGVLDGAGIQRFASGGVRYGENHKAVLSRANGRVRIWAEPETGGEAYIPMARSKRPRSLRILDEVAKRFGLALSPVARRFENGGIAGAAQSLMNSGRMVQDTARDRRTVNEFNFTINSNGPVDVETFARMVSREIANSQNDF